tara:strand:- start:1679 stop:1837 length:159 start_codon:yes stop_codon:yes gene_type:complete
MEEYLNYWLKKTIKNTPNDVELDKKTKSTNKECKGSTEINLDTDIIKKNKTN